MKKVFDYHHNVLSKFTFLEVIFVLIPFIGDSCHYWMDLENQMLSSPYYPQNYFTDGIGCEWVITAPEGHIISLEFDHFSVSKYIISKYLKMFINCSGPDLAPQKFLLSQ